MLSFLGSDYIHFTAWIYDPEPGLTVLYVTGTGEIAVWPDSERVVQVPAVPFKDRREVTAAAERLFARAAMMAPPVRAADLASHFAKLDVTCLYRVWLAGEELALPEPELLGMVSRCEGHYGMFLYAERVVRVRG